MSKKDKAGYQIMTVGDRVAFAAYNNTVSKFEAVSQASPDQIVASTHQIVTDIAGRNPFTRSDYDSFRPNEAVPNSFPDIVRACRAVYRRNGTIRNVVDLMTDFVCEDMRIVHSQKSVEAFFKVYRQKIDLDQAVSEFSRHFIVEANTVVKRITARLTKSVENSWTSSASPDIKAYIDNNAPEEREIPWRYVFLSPTMLEWSGGDAARMTGVKQLLYQLDSKLISVVKNPKNDLERRMVAGLPDDVRKAILRNDSRKISLDMSKIYVAHNKKDSWDDWATPFLVSVLPDLIYKDKLRQADTSALDGVINVIRLWKLGDHTNKIFPGPEVVEKLINILQSHTGGGAMDIVWDSLIDMEEHYPPVEKILGPEKYTQVNSDILMNLGVPDVLLGGKGANFSNSFIQLKTIIERLKYVRNAVLNWLNHEMDLVCQAIGIKERPRITFANMNLEDENVSRQLMLSLFDRGVLSVETLLTYFGEDYTIEIERIKHQTDIFTDKMKVKGPFVREPFDRPGVGGKKVKTGKNGRPANTQDITRKQRKAKPRISASLILYALDAADTIDTQVTNWYLRKNDIANARKFTNTQKEEVEALRVLVLACIKPLDDSLSVSIDHILGNIDKESQTANGEVIQSIEAGVTDFINNKGRSPTVEERKRIEAMSYASVYIKEEKEEE